MSSQLAWRFEPRASFGPQDFLISASNQSAHTQILSWTKWPSHVLILEGPKGSGKTHLAHFWAHKSGAIFLEAKSVGTAPAAQLLGSAKMAIVENFLEADETGLFHLCNEIRDRQGWLLLTTATPLNMHSFKLPDLSSRLKAAGYVTMSEPDDALLSAVLAKGFADRQLRVGPDVIQYLLPRIERSFVAAQQVVAAIDAASLEKKREITLPLVRSVLT